MQKLFSLLFFLSACGSSLDTGDELVIPPRDDYKLVNFEDKLVTTLLEYQIAHDVTHVLLVFGSEYCFACQEKNDELIGKYANHSIFSKPKFKLVGINIDEDFDYAKIYLADNGYGFVTLWDEEARFLINTFYKNAASWGTPTTVLMTGDEILFQYNFRQKQDMGKILDRAEQYL
jgi:thioredoxin-related protein